MKMSVFHALPRVSHKYWWAFVRFMYVTTILIWLLNKYKLANNPEKGSHHFFALCSNPKSRELHTLPSCDRPHSNLKLTKTPYKVTFKVRVEGVCETCMHFRFRIRSHPEATSVYISKYSKVQKHLKPVSLLILHLVRRTPGLRLRSAPWIVLIHFFIFEIFF